MRLRPDITFLREEKRKTKKKRGKKREIAEKIKFCLTFDEINNIIYTLIHMHDTIFFT